MTAGDGCCPGGRVGCAGTRGGTAGAAPGTAAPPGTAIGRATPGGGTCVREGWLAKLLRTLGSTWATTGATGRRGTSELPGTTLTAPATPWLVYRVGLVGRAARRAAREQAHLRRVHCAPIAAAAGVVRVVRLARCQRNPADVRPGASPVVRTAADPRHHGRRIDGPRDAVPRRPAPGAADVHPASVVERREAPRRVVDPGPAPGTHDHPVAVAVWRPTRRHGGRVPHLPVLGIRLPAAVAVEVFSAGHLGRDVLGHRDPIVLAVGTRRPIGKVVALRVAPGVVSGVLRALAPQLGAAAGRNAERAVVTLELQLADPGGADARIVATVDPEVADAARREPPFGGGHFDLARHLGRAHAHRNAAVVQEQIDAIVVEPADLQLAAAGQAHHGRTDANLEAPGVIDRDPVAAGQRAVALEADPLAGLGVVDLALPFGDAPDAARGIVGGKRR